MGYKSEIKKLKKRISVLERESQKRREQENVQQVAKEIRMLFSNNTQ